jgi:hypothetical protein
MSRPFPRRLLTVFAVTTLVSTLAASVCPNCETDLNGGVPGRDCAVAAEFANDWEADAAGCACCEADPCDGTGELPEGRIRRVLAPVHALPVAVAVIVPTPGPWGGAGARPPDAPPPARVRLHLQYASLLC